jgi:thiamine biosynthesis protein ThiI
MGDSLGQVASQTLQNIKVIDQAVKIPILRPLIGFDKEEIVSIAKEIGTYKLSILPSEGCSAVPKNPATKAKLENILKEEDKIDIKRLVKEMIDKSKKLSI